MDSPQHLLDTQSLQLTRLGPVEWEIPKGTVPGMKTSSRLIASEILLQKIRQDRTLRQLANIACLPGIHGTPVAMPDAHEGYGFPIGGVAALDYETGGISPGGIGYDINCGVRLIRTNLSAQEVRPKMKELLDALHEAVPSGVGRGTKKKLSAQEIDEILSEGSRIPVRQEAGFPGDLEFCEEKGRMPGAEPGKVSPDAKKRGKDQLGTLGAGNHFLEIQEIQEIANQAAAKTFGISPGQIVIMVHCGSRGLGHQVCSDYLRIMEDKFHKEIAELPDRELAYAPAGTREAADYFSAMVGAVNFAFANRQAITSGIRRAFGQVFRADPEKFGMSLVYDVAHNIAKIEDYGGKVYLHRKGATRAFGPGRPEVPQEYRSIGQPVLLPGSMGTASYVLVGSAKAIEKTFGSTAHGAGRVMSRGEALRKHRGEEIARNLSGKGIIVKCASWKSVAEEAPDCYKDVDEVARVSDEAGIGTVVARLKPLGVLKG
ncbi:MAG: RtcB family protein [archaeon]